MFSELKFLPGLVLLLLPGIAEAQSTAFPDGRQVRADALSVAASKTFSVEKGLAPAELRCEYLAQPLGIGETAPRLSWIVVSEERAQRQTAYRVLVASSSEMLALDQGDLWDSGKVYGDDTTAVVYEGSELRSHQQCFWKVKVWDKLGRESQWSEFACWSMGLMDPGDLKAQWIGYDASRPALPPVSAGVATNTIGQKTKPPEVLPPARYLRAQFRLNKPLQRAVLYASALGLADMYLNGRRVSEDYFSPGWTDYKKRVYYRTYDVTDLMRFGENAIGAVLADGWFSGYLGYKGGRDTYGRHPRLWAQLRLEFEDGSISEVATGPNWRATTGPILSADFLKGEVYDARLERNGWSQPGGDDGHWESVNLGSGPVKPLIQAHPGPPVRAIHEFTPGKITEPRPGVFVLDFGQNFAGVARLQVRGQTGQKITLRFAERLNADGTIYTANLRAARATDTYICKGKGLETWQPRFTFHGFQFAEITGLDSRPGPDTLTGVALSSDSPDAGEFTCSEPMLNQLRNNVYWTQRANFIEVPTDCPQRDERLGWTGDAQIYIRTATLNSDLHAFFAKWLRDLEDSQRADGQFPCIAPYVKCSSDDGGPAWADAGVICPWTIYSVYGDRRILERHYDSMTRFIEFCRKRSTAELLPPPKFRGYGDWLNLNADTPKDLVYTAYFAGSTKLTASAAAALGKMEDAAKYEAMFKTLRQSFNQAYVLEDGRIKGDTQTGYVLALAFDLLEGEKVTLAANHLIANIESRGWHLSTGFVGTKDLMLVLTKIGRTDVAYRLLLNDTYPSWGFSIKNGATSIWERWDGWTPKKGFQNPTMNSFAHYSFGAVYQWMVENIGGISPASPGYQQILIAPQIEGKLSSATVSYRSIRGRIETHWKKQRDQQFVRVLIPANTAAVLLLPAQSAEQVTEGGLPLSDVEGITGIAQRDGKLALSIGSGRYDFLIRNVAVQSVSLPARESRN